MKRVVFLVILAAFLAIACTKESALTCFDIEPSKEPRIMVLRQMAANIAKSLDAKFADKSEGDKIWVQLEKSSFRLTILSFSSNSPLMCFYGDPGDALSQRVISQVLDELTRTSFRFSIATPGKMSSLPSQLRQRIENLSSRAMPPAKPGS